MRPLFKLGGLLRERHPGRAGSRHGRRRRARLLLRGPRHHRPGGHHGDARCAGAGRRPLLTGIGFLVLTIAVLRPERAAEPTPQGA